jgi:signal transduction histidine kinase
MIPKLKRKLYFLFVGCIMFVFTIVFVLLAYENMETKRTEEVDFITRQATNLTLLFEISSDYETNLEICEQKFGYAFRLYQEPEQVIYESTNMENVSHAIDVFLNTLKQTEAIYSDENEAAHSSQSGTYTFQTENGTAYYGVLCSIYSETGYLNLAIIKEKRSLSAFLPLIVRYLLIWLVVFIILLFVTHFLIRQAVKPTEKAMQSQKDFIAAASHELKNPLAVIISSSDMIENLPDCNDEIKKYMELIDDETSRMTRLVQDLLLLSSIDAGNWTLHKSAIDVDTLLINLYEKFEMICKQKSIDLQLKTPNECFPSIISDEDRLNQIISIFLDNAISYSPEQSVILLEASIQKSNLTIGIIDHGIGISEADKKHIFDRFYRCDKSRTQKGHFGLGLSVANELIAILDGEIFLTDTPGGGCTFTITIPC